MCHQCALIYNIDVQTKFKQEVYYFDQIMQDPNIRRIVSSKNIRKENFHLDSPKIDDIQHEVCI